jgi:hypothetical protein
LPEVVDEPGSYTCELCGVVRSAASGCTCNQDETGEHAVPEGWDPELTSGRDRLPLMQRPE